METALGARVGSGDERRREVGRDSAAPVVGDEDFDRDAHNREGNVRSLISSGRAASTR